MFTTLDFPVILYGQFTSKEIKSKKERREMNNEIREKLNIDNSLLLKRMLRK
jgi:hypothetical protein